MDRDHDQNSGLDAAIRRRLRLAPGRSKPADPTFDACSRAAREAMDHLNDPDLAADMAAVQVPRDELLQAAGMTGPLDIEDDPVQPESWFQAFCHWLWSPGMGYAVAAAVLVFALISGRGPSAEKLMPQQIVLGEFVPTRSVDVDIPELVIGAGAEMIDLTVERSIDPDRGFRLQAILYEVDGDRSPWVDSTSDSRLFVDAPGGGVYPVYRVPVHLLRAGVTYKLEFRPVDAEGNLMENATFSSLFRVAD